MKWMCTLVVLIAVPVVQAAFAVPPRVTIAANGHFLVAEGLGKPVRVNLPDTSPDAAYPVRVNSTVLLAYQRRAGRDYLLVLVNGMSLGGKPTGHCGAGVEQRVWWLAIEKGVVRAMKHQAVASCWRQLESGSIRWKHGICTIRWIANQDATNEIRYALRYDTRTPGKGFVVEARRRLLLKSSPGNGARR